eukprot:scaffold270502_cov33-Prasinocladus_malaysianus.AAC.1
MQSGYGSHLESVQGLLALASGRDLQHFCDAGDWGNFGCPDNSAYFPRPSATGVQAPSKVSVSQQAENRNESEESRLHFQPHQSDHHFRLQSSNAVQSCEEAATERASWLHSLLDGPADGVAPTQMSQAYS